MNDGFIKSYPAAGAISGYHMIVAGDDNTVETAVDGSQPFMGVTGMLGAKAAGDMCDVVRSKLPDVRYGAAVTRMDRLTADSQGRAVPVGTPEPGETIHYLGFAEIDGVEDDIGAVFIAPGAITGETTAPEGGA